MSFTATATPSARSNARQTSPIAFLPANRSSSNRSESVSPGVINPASIAAVDPRGLSSSNPTAPAGARADDESAAGRRFAALAPRWTDAQCVDAARQGGAGDSELTRRVGDDSARSGERVEDHGLLSIFDLRPLVLQ